MEMQLPSGEVLRVDVDEVDVSSALDGRGFLSRTIPGRVSYWLDDRPISPEEYERLKKQARPTPRGSSR
jgi:hypothetical protein